MLRKERENQKDLEETIGLVNFIPKRDLVNRGRHVNPSGKQWKEVQTIAATLRVKKSKSKTPESFDTEDSADVADFDLLSKGVVFVNIKFILNVTFVRELDRLHVHNGPLNKRDPDGILWKTSRKHLFVFNDVILITTNKENK